MRRGVVQCTGMGERVGLCYVGREWSVYSGSGAQGGNLAGIEGGGVWCGVDRGSGWRVRMARNCVLCISCYVV